MVVLGLEVGTMHFLELQVIPPDAFKVLKRIILAAVGPNGLHIHKGISQSANILQDSYFYSKTLRVFY